MLKYRKNFFIISGMLVTVSILSLFIFGLNFGIDFTGGSLLEISAQNDPKITARQIEGLLEKQNEVALGDVRVQPTDNSFIIRMREITEQERVIILKQLQSTVSENIQEIQFESIGPIVGDELKKKALWQIALVSGAIVLYIAYAFRKVSKLKEKSKTSWKFGFVALVALVHDVSITLGVFAFLGKFHSVEIDNSFIAAILMVLGYSVNDTIVVFDRIRENMIKHKYISDIEKIINKSVRETLVRSINTSSTTLIVLLSILLFGGSSIFYFVLALFIGIAVGTYSSIFIASPLLYEWEKRSS